MIPTPSYFNRHPNPFELLRNDLKESNEGCPCTRYDQKIGAGYEHLLFARIGYLEYPYEGTMIDQKTCDELSVGYKDRIYKHCDKRNQYLNSKGAPQTCLINLQALKTILEN